MHSLTRFHTQPGGFATPHGVHAPSLESRSLNFSQFLKPPYWYFAFGCAFAVVCAFSVALKRVHVHVVELCHCFANWCPDVSR
jgi:hypothetical protein